MVSDNWPGLDTFFILEKEILLPAGSADVERYITGYDESDLRKIGRAARERVLTSHASDVRAREFERSVEIASTRPQRALAEKI
jgi:spore maturation protein CgeB